jgi:hypothetical protein
MKNVTIHIVLPRGLALTNGAALDTSLSYQVVSELDPYYTTIDAVRLEGGMWLNKLGDLTIALSIHQNSQKAQVISYNRPMDPIGFNEGDLGFRRWRLFHTARQQYVTSLTAREMISNIHDLVGGRGSKTLGNLSVSRQMMQRDESIPNKLQELRDEIKQWEITIKSGGDIGPGGHARPQMAAKGFYDLDSLPAGRLWATTGMGANRKTLPGFGSNNKPMKFYTKSPFMTKWAMGNVFNSSPVALLKTSYLWL